MVEEVAAPVAPVVENLTGGSAPAQGDTEAEQAATPVAPPEPPAPDVAAVADSPAPVVEDATESLAPVVGNVTRAADAGG